MFALDHKYHILFIVLKIGKEISMFNMRSAWSEKRKEEDEKRKCLGWIGKPQMHRYFQGTHPISVHCYYRFSDFPLITKLILHYYIIGNDVFVKIVREVGAIGMN